MTQANTDHRGALIVVTVIGQEGDSKPVSINPRQKCIQLLKEGLRELYGTPSPNPDEYDLVLGGRTIEPLSRSVAEAGIAHGATISIVPKRISRGGA